MMKRRMHPRLQGDGEFLMDGGFDGGFRVRDGAGGCGEECDAAAAWEAIRDSLPCTLSRMLRRERG